MAEKEQPNYYAIIPAEVRYSEDLAPNEKLLYGEITALCNKTGQCFATNQYFAELYKVEIETISRWIKHLVGNGYITSFIDKQKGNVRYIQLNQYLLIKNAIPIDKKINRGIDKKINNNNTSMNNTNNNICNSEHTKRFVKPTLEEVQAYCKERNNNVDAQRFIDFYQSKGWKVGNQPMKDWKACVRTWENKDRKKPEETKSQFITHNYSSEQLNDLFDDLDNVKVV